MSKIHRNDPCPCGSGKKYKNCHGANNVIDFDPNLINQRLNQLHQQLITFAFENYEQQLSDQITAYSQLSVEDNEELADIYNTGLAIWIIFNVPFLSRQRTVFDAFSEKQMKNIDFSVRSSFQKWNGTVPSVYEVESEETSSESSVMVRELISNETFEVPIISSEQVNKGMLFVGALLPFMRFHNFFYTFIKLFDRKRDDIKALLQKYQDKDGTLKESFPKFLAEALVQEPEIEISTNGKVPQLFANKMLAKDMEEEVVRKGISLWNEYQEKENPSIKKAESYAAALEYYVQKHIMKNDSLTQTEIADEYNVAAGTVSNNYRKLIDALGGKS
ncbi:SEC-C metal-binding domain-containing protein [Ornithinibacillus scapharcae]|uniref:SEC-C metal-binding domain-containing protein n=1 Tax=Ornithinibacillus scapharcae TaxID=1147159 RepID=UPI000225B9C7|nr:SEC-C metal-binding domain-containing protein [Ornithinibacillus scapharcae]